MNTTDESRVSNTDLDIDSNPSVRHGHGIHAEKQITIDRSPQDVYEYWHNFENLPSFMDHLKSVTVTGPTTSHWVAKAPLGNKVEWDATIINDIPNELIAWKSIDNADVANAGSIHFSPSAIGEGTDIRVELSYEPPAGVAGAAVAKLFGEEPSQQIEDDLNRFKAFMEGNAVGNTVEP